MKTLRIYITKPCEDISWKDMGNILRNLQYDTAKILNYCMNQWYVWQNEKETFKIKNGKYPTFQELPSPAKEIYKRIREMYPKIGSRMASCLVQKSQLKWKSDCKEVMYSQTKSLSTFRKTTPILVDKQSCKIEKTLFGYTFTATLFSTDAEKDQRRFTFILNTKKIQKSQKQILDNIISGTYKNGAAQIGCHKNKWFVNFAYEPPKKIINLDTNIIVGVDLGVSKAFYCAVNNSKERLCADGFEIEQFRKRIRKFRRSIFKQGPFSGRKSKGRKKMLKPSVKISDKERNFRDTRYHQYSKMIVDFAVKNNAGIIQMEDLKNLKKSKINDSFLKNWAVSDLQNKIEYKAAEYNIQVKYVNPQYTSQRCYKCGNISSENRKDQQTFLCTVCGQKENADYNAACNLALESIEDIIANHKLA